MMIHESGSIPSGNRNELQKGEGFYRQGKEVINGKKKEKKERKRIVSGEVTFLSGTKGSIREITSSSFGAKKGSIWQITSLVLTRKFQTDWLRLYSWGS